MVIPTKKLKKKRIQLIVSLVAVFSFCWILFSYISSLSNDEGHQFSYSDAIQIEVPQKHPIHGIDVSHHNGIVPWNHLTELEIFDTVSLKFVFIKATEGRSLQDPNFQVNWRKAKQKGLTAGAYHFYIPTRDPIEQAKNFCKMVQLQEGDLPPVCDIEVTNSVSHKKIRKDIKAFLNYLTDYYHTKPILYTNTRMYSDLFNNEEFTDFPLWLASYETNTIVDADNLRFWQYSKHGKLEGNSKSWDYNVFLGDHSEFASMLIK